MWDEGWIVLTCKNTVNSRPAVTRRRFDLEMDYVDMCDYRKRRITNSTQNRYKRKSSSMAAEIEFAMSIVGTVQESLSGGPAALKIL
jgi:hypothetical protein